MREGGLRVSGEEELVRVLQVSHLHVNIEPGHGSLWAQAPLQLLERRRVHVRYPNLPSDAGLRAAMTE